MKKYAKQYMICLAITNVGLYALIDFLNVLLNKLMEYIICIKWILCYTHIVKTKPSYIYEAIRMDKFVERIWQRYISLTKIRS